MIEIKDDIYTLGIWFVHWNGADWMLSIQRPKEGGPWKGSYRFRYHNSPDPFDFTDTKNWYGFQVPPETTEDVIISTANRMAAFIALARNGTMDRTLIQGCGLEIFQEKANGKEWFHMRAATAEEEKLFK